MLKLAELAEKFPPMDLPVPVPFMALLLISACSLSIDLILKELVTIACENT